ncbi:hypothetical protein JI435_402530 [Parastagonospora nodorum SN15]|uniref:Uncharacterized protein n=1 Tax=Phaeosphaeria nodorum (strain SN15 / ATCC MYA-4574 / FGSC 10173) TaxID=321614 RepID=A0A7U2HUL3_PHANO|nr:hypothetical protein JI435_402530 [Parastagonospora nodorum SN15]
MTMDLGNTGTRPAEPDCEFDNVFEWPLACIRRITHPASVTYLVDTSRCFPQGG